MLDRSRTRAGEPDGEALHHTLRRAVRAEDLGYERFWVSEHHAVPGVASSSPPVLLAAVGARTSRIRIGSGGVMLPLHQPLVVAQQFLMLEAMHPRRVDLGVGRSLGFTGPVRRALRRDDQEPDSFSDDVVELRDYLTGTAEVTARPRVPGQVPLVVLATGRGLDVAADLGLPVVVGGPLLWSEELSDALGRYRRRFRSTGGSAAQVAVSLDVLLADTDHEARRLALPEAWAAARARQTGSFPPLQDPEQVEGDHWPAQVRRRVEHAVQQTVAGPEATVRPQLESLVERSGADELVTSSSTFDLDALAESDRRLRELLA